MKPVHIKSGYRNKLDVHTAIVPGKTAAGLFVGDPITVLPEPTGAMRTTLGDNVELIDYGPVRIWIRNGAIEQIGVLSGYTGHVSGTSIGIGSSIRQVIKIMGAVVEDEEDNLIVSQLPGICFETEAWCGTPGNETVKENLDAKLTEIFVFPVQPC